jgi:hypothetical protein
MPLRCHWCHTTTAVATAGRTITVLSLCTTSSLGTFVESYAHPRCFTDILLFMLLVPNILLCIYYVVI